MLDNNNNFFNVKLESIDVGDVLVNIAVDFGTTNTMVGVYDLGNNDLSVFSLDNISVKLGKYKAIPSKIAYYPNGKFKIGNAILPETPDNQIFSRLKLYLSDSELKSIKRKIGTEKYDHRQAGRDFLSLVLDFIFSFYPKSDINKMVLTAPVNSFDTYRVFLTEICESKRFYNYLILDESTAVALGYDAVISPDYPYAIIDFGGGTLDISIVRINNAIKPNKVDVFGKAGSNIGGEEIDNWLTEDFLQKNNLTLTDIKSFKAELKSKLEELKISLSRMPSAEFKICNKEADYDIIYSLDKAGFEDILRRKFFPNIFQETLDTAIGLSIENGIRKADIKKVFLVGGSSQIPYFTELARLNFGQKVQINEPFSAVINGACKFISGTIIEDFLHHDYCLKHFNRNKGLYEYEVIVPQKTKFPAVNICQKIISSAFDGQEEIELEFFEILSNVYESETVSDISYDQKGNLIAVKEIKDTLHNKKIIPLNKNQQHFISLDPPGLAKEARIKITFNVSENRILTLDAIDLKTNRIYYKNREIARLK